MIEMEIEMPNDSIISNKIEIVESCWKQSLQTRIHLTGDENVQLVLMVEKEGKHKTKQQFVIRSSGMAENQSA